MADRGDSDNLVSEEDEDDEDYNEGKSQVSRNKRKSANADRDVHKKKKSKNDVDWFLDVEAVHDSDDEDEDVDDSELLHIDEGHHDIDEAELANKRASAFAGRQDNNRRSAGRNMMASVIDRLEKRAAEVGEGEAGIDLDHDFDAAEEAVEQNLQSHPVITRPARDDPKIFIVKCLSSGRERELCIQIITKFNENLREGRVKEFPICSVYAADHTRGYIYVEAYSQPDVKSALSGIRDLNIFSGVKLLPVTDYEHLFKPGKDPTREVRQSMWVRPKRGLYAGDLAQVMDALDNEGRVWIRLKPRVRISDVVQKSKEEQTLRENLYQGMQRPNPRLISFTEIQAHDGQIDMSNNFEFGDEIATCAGLKLTKAGYLLKKVAKSTLSLNEKPQLQEIMEFDQSQAAASENDFATPVATPMQKQFTVGDRVKCIAGDMHDAIGDVTALKPEAIVVKFEELDEPTECVESQLKKIFYTGEHVQVLAGIHAGLTGMVSTQGPLTGFTEIFLDADSTVVRVDPNNLKFAQDLSKGLDQVGEYKLKDLVQFQNEIKVGVIVKIEQNELIHVLTKQGDVEIVKMWDLKSRILKKSTTVDANQSPLCVGNHVVLKDVDATNPTPRKGIVEHIYGSCVWIALTGMAPNGLSTIATRGSCVLTEESQKIQESKSIRTVPVASRGRGGGMGFPRPRRTEDMGKKVRILRGSKKGFVGTIRKETATHVTVLLDSASRTIEVLKSDILVEDGIMDQCNVSLPRMDAPADMYNSWNSNTFEDKKPSFEDNKWGDGGDWGAEPQADDWGTYQQVELPTWAIVGAEIVVVGEGEFHGRKGWIRKHPGDETVHVDVEAIGSMAPDTIAIHYESLEPAQLTTNDWICVTKCTSRPELEGKKGTLLLEQSKELGEAMWICSIEEEEVMCKAGDTQLVKIRATD
eukprot:Platyproteum_vivax@DN6221_c0_g1_i2.p1